MHVKSRVIASLAALSLVAGVIAVTAGIGSSAASSGSPNGPADVLYVSAGSAGGDAATTLQAGAEPVGGAWLPRDVSAQRCADATYTTITAAIAAASPGDTIVVCAGVYDEEVVVPATTPLTIVGVGDPIIDAFDPATSTSLTNGFQVLASHTTIEGFTVAYAEGEGILVGACAAPVAPASIAGCTPDPAEPTPSYVAIRHNTVIDNDRGNPTAGLIADTASTYSQCNEALAAPAPATPGDCGEGIHLLSAVDSVVEDNVVTGNSGGILLSDENGPTHGNLVASNRVVGNAYDCGITVAGHHLGTTTNGTTWSTVLASVGGLFDNTVRNNVSIDNGVLGQGGGVLLATGVPGGAVYNNLVEGNVLAGNGLGGVTVHSHSPGEDLSGNTITGNTIGTNDLDGDADFGGNTPPAVDAATTGIIVANATGNNPIAITITHNRISHDNYGIWMTPLVSGSFAPNTFIGDAVDTFTS